MIKTIPLITVLALAAASPALAQQSPSDTTPPAQPQRQGDVDQQARTPGSEQRKSGEVETLRQKSMSSPNVEGEKVQEDPATGVPSPAGREDPRRQESIPRP